MKQVNKTEFVRVEKTENYTVIHNQFLRRKDLSWKAKGILSYILSLPDDWNINLEEVMQHATEGKSAFRSGWKELRDAGYVKRQPVKDKDTKKILHWETVVFENVDMSTSEPHADYPPSGKPVDGKPDSGKSNTTKYLKELSTNKQSTNRDTPSPKKKKHGDAENVLLTEEEYQKLKDRFSDYEERINNLSYYIASKGAKYKSHYMTILAWARKDKPKSDGSWKNLIDQE